MSCVRILYFVAVVLLHVTSAVEFIPCASDCDCFMRNGERCVFRDGDVWHHCSKLEVRNLKISDCLCLKGCMGLNGTLVQRKKKTEKCDKFQCSCDDASRNKMSCCEAPTLPVFMIL